MKTLDLNADLAEGFAFDEPLLKLVSSANIACGLHAGNAVDMRRAVSWARQYHVRVGAHPSYPDREHFGRLSMALPPEELADYLRYQLGVLQAVCFSQHIAMSYVKPHGALYNDAAKSEVLSRLIVETVRAFDPHLKIMGLSGSLLLKTAQALGVETISEVFADRRYLPDGSLVPRTQPNAMVASDDEAIAQVLQMATTGKVTAIDGTPIAVNAQSVCLHGDNAHALVFAERLHEAFAKNQIKVTA